MDGERFLDILYDLAGHDNAVRYTGRFKELDDPYLFGLLNYEACALYTYTTGMLWHDTINRELWSGSPSNATSEFTAVLNHALSKLPSYRTNGGLVYRGYNTINIPDFLTHYSVNSLILFPGFTSASFKEEYAFFGNILYVINSLSAKIIWYYAANYDEFEVLIPAGKIFLVTNITRQPDKAVIFLEEQP